MSNFLLNFLTVGNGAIYQWLVQQILVLRIVLADIDTQGIIVLRSCNIVKDEINLTDLVRVKTSIRENQFVQKDDILICARNGSRSLVGKMYFNS